MILCKLLLAVLIFLLLLWYKSEKARFYMAICFLFFTSTFCMTLTYPMMIYRGRSPKNALFGGQFTIKIVEFMGFNMEIRGLENVNSAHGSVLVINHQSSMDTYVYNKLLLNIENLCGTAKQELIYSGPFGLGLWLVNFFFLKRKNLESCKNTISESSRSIKQKNYRVLYFPEGTRNYYSKNLLPFKLGAFHAALEAECPIQPIAVSRHHFLFPGKFENKRIIIEILPEMSTKGLTENTLRSFSENCRSVMQKKVNELSDETLK